MENTPQFPIAPLPFSATPRKVDAGACFEWLRQGWAFFSGNAGIWLGAAAIVLLITIVLHLIPVFGMLAANLLLPAFVAGMLVMCRKQSAGETLAIGDLFAGFQQRAGALVIVGVLYMTAILLIWLALSVLVLGGGVAGGMAGTAAGIGMALGAFMLAGLLWLVLMIPVAMAVLFAPALVFFNDMPPLEAMKASFNACASNLLAFVVFGIVMLVLGSLAAIPLGLGFLVLLPVASGALYAAYRDVFPGT